MLSSPVHSPRKIFSFPSIFSFPFFIFLLHIISFLYIYGSRIQCVTAFRSNFPSKLTTLKNTHTHCQQYADRHVSLTGHLHNVTTRKIGSLLGLLDRLFFN